MRPLPRYCSASGTPNSRSRHAPLARITAEKPHSKSWGRLKSRPSLVEGMKYTLGFFMRASIRAYYCLRCATCQRGNAPDRLRSCRTAECSARTRRLEFRDPPESPPPPSLKSHRQLPRRNDAQDSSYICHSAHGSEIVQRKSCKVSPTTEGFYDGLQNSCLVAASSTGRCNAFYQS